MTYPEFKTIFTAWESDNNAKNGWGSESEDYQIARLYRDFSRGRFIPACIKSLG